VRSGLDDNDDDDEERALRTVRAGWSDQMRMQCGAVPGRLALCLVWALALDTPDSEHSAVGR
jgi:hypothetical protein